MTTVRQLSFAGGELSDSLQGRVDLVKYATGAKIMRNRYVRRDGGTDNRPGTSFVSEIKNSSEVTRILPFQFSLDRTYVLEFTRNAIRFIKHGSPVLETAKAITGITTAAQAVFSIVAHGYSDGQEIYINAITNGPKALNGRNFIIDSATTNTFKLRYRDNTFVDTTAMPAWVAGGTAERVYEVSTTYVPDDLPFLDYAQSAEVFTIANQNYAPRELSISSETSWSIGTINFVPGISAPSGFSSGAGGSFNAYRVTAVKDESFEESLPSSTFSCGTVTPAPDAALTFQWNPVSGARYYRVYRRVNGVFAFVNTAAAQGGSVFFTDIGVTPDTTDTPPDSRNPFNGANNWPAVVGLVGQRRFFANTKNDSERIDGSRTGFPRNYTISTPQKDDSALTFRIYGDRVNPITHLVNLKGLLVFTKEGEIAVGARDSGSLTPFSLNQDQNSYNGSNHIKPILSGNRVLYVQSNGRQIFDFGFDVVEDAYKPGELTAFASHLFDKHQISDWAYQKTPNSIVWVARSDGKLISLTYVKDQDIVAFCRHDLDGGRVENVCCVSEDNETFLYLVVKRTVDGRTVRYIERMNTRVIEDQRDMVFVDSAIRYDGRNTNEALSLKLTGGSGDWPAGQFMSVQASEPYFTAEEIGNAIQFFYTDEQEVEHRIDFTIETFSNSITVGGRCSKAVPTALRNTDVTNWIRAVDDLTGLWHLEGKAVSILGDGAVVKSVYNKQYLPLVTVENGALHLAKPYGVIHVGLPITSDLVTLDIDTAQGETMLDKQKQIGKLSIRVAESRGGFAGTYLPDANDDNQLNGLYEIQRRENEQYGETPTLFTGLITDEIERSWTPGGSICIRQVDPLPLSILSVAPAGWLPLGG